MAVSARSLVVLITQITRDDRTRLISHTCRMYTLIASAEPIDHLGHRPRHKTILHEFVCRNMHVLRQVDVLWMKVEDHDARNAAVAHLTPKRCGRRHRPRALGALG